MGSRAPHLKIYEFHGTHVKNSLISGSLYQDEISVEPAEVIPILATASLFQMDGLADQCANIMEETVNIETVIYIYILT